MVEASGWTFRSNTRAGTLSLALLSSSPYVFEEEQNFVHWEAIFSFSGFSQSSSLQLFAIINTIGFLGVRLWKMPDPCWSFRLRRLSVSPHLHSSCTFPPSSALWFFVVRVLTLYFLIGNLRWHSDRYWSEQRIGCLPQLDDFHLPCITIERNAIPFFFGLNNKFWGCTE